MAKNWSEVIKGRGMGQVWKGKIALQKKIFICKKTETISMFYKLWKENTTLTMLINICCHAVFTIWTMKR